MDPEDEELLLARKEYESLKSSVVKVRKELRACPTFSRNCAFYVIMVVYSSNARDQDGLREGIAAGLQKSRQIAFDQGLRDGFSEGFSRGRCSGQLR